MAFTNSNDIHYYASLISMKNNEALFYWHLELLHCTLLHSFQEMMKGKVEQSGLSLLFFGPYNILLHQQSVKQTL